MSLRLSGFRFKIENIMKNRLMLHIFSTTSIVHTHFYSKQFDSFVQHMIGVSPKPAWKNVIFVFFFLKNQKTSQDVLFRSSSLYQTPYKALKRQNFDENFDKDFIHF